MLHIEFMEASVWSARLEEFREGIAAGNSITGAVAVSAVSGALAATVLQMVLEVAARKHPSPGLESLIAATRDVANKLARSADEDRAAYAAFCETLKLPKTTTAEQAARQQARARALRRATQVPLEAARAAAQAIELCAAAAPFAAGAIAADIGGAAALLAGAVRAILVSVDANLRQLEDQPGYDQLLELRHEVEHRTAHQAGRVIEQIAKRTASPPRSN
jgi:methenyltetrahydrofolate cyclohydrolase